MTSTTSIFGIQASTFTAQPFGVAGSWTISFHDEFNGSVLDTAKWTAQNGNPTSNGGAGVSFGNFGHQLWTPSNVSVGGGLLTLSVTNSVGVASGGLIGSPGKFKGGYGFYEVYAQFPTGVGGWPAFWMSTHTVGDTATPSADGLEWDIAESTPWANDSAHVQNAVHVSYSPDNSVTQAVAAGSDGGWHYWGFNWQPTFTDFYCDGTKTLRYTATLVTPAGITDSDGEYILINNASYAGGADSGICYFDYVRYWTGS